MYGELTMDTTFSSRVVCLEKEISMSDCFGAVVQDPGHSSCRHGDLVFVGVHQKLVPAADQIRWLPVAVAPQQHETEESNTCPWDRYDCGIITFVILAIGFILGIIVIRRRGILHYPIPLLVVQ